MKEPSTFPGEPLFSFAVVADTHINEGENQCNSPFKVNQLANARLRHVIEDLNQRDLAFVMHLGDVVHPVPSMGDTYDTAMNLFKAQCQGLRHPIHVVPGNHDVGDKPIKWGPAGTVRQSFLDAWSRHFDNHYFAFEHGDLLVVGINVQLLGSGLPLECQQRDWLEQTLANHQEKRIHLFMHYPPFLNNDDEPEHYDNLSADSRKWVIGLIEAHRVEALYAGHVHHFWFNRIGNCHCYLLPSTCFTRQDYTEMFRVPPGDEYGRNDVAKLGYFLVHVYTDSHRIEMIRSNGEIKSPVDSRIVSSSEQNTQPDIISPTPIIAFDLRQDWCEQVQIPPSGALDEFDRKWVRNDYALLALVELGVKRLRIPLADLRDPSRLSRLYDLNALGFTYTLYSFELPSEKDLTLIANNSKLIETWEISTRDIDALDIEMRLQPYPSIRMISLAFSPMRSKAETLASGKEYFHVINHGFFAHDHDLGEKLEHLKEKQPYFDSIVLRCGLDDDIWKTAAPK